MNRILVIGCSGGGKSTLARELELKLGSPIVHLDVLFWRPGWVESSYDEFRPKVEAAVAEDRWIMDGNYSRTFDIRMPRADTVIWVDQPRLLCIWRAFARTMRQFNKVRADLAPGCPEKIDLGFYRYIWNFRKKNEAATLEALARYAPTAELIRLRSDREIAVFLEGV
jgi:adenylate kinase family enzyme